MKGRLDDIRLRFEECSREIERDGCLARSGYGSRIHLKSILDRFADLGSRTLIDLIRSEVETHQHASPASEQVRSLKLLLRHAIRTHLTYSGRDLWDRFWSTATQGMVRLGREAVTIPFLRSEQLVRNEENGDRRKVISAGRDEFIAKDLTPLYAALRAREWEKLAEIGVEDAAVLIHALDGIDLSGLLGQGEDFLARTAEMYRDMLAGLSEKKLGVRPIQLEDHDLAFVTRAGEFDRHFQPSEMSTRILRFVSKLNLDLGSREAIRLDLETRPGKWPGAHCAVIRVPEEIQVVVDPTEGGQSYQAFLNELGRALHFAHIDPSADWEYKRLGDASISEGFATLFCRLVHDRTWLRKVMGWSQSEEYRRLKALGELVALRRGCETFSAQFALEKGKTLTGNGTTYMEILRNSFRSGSIPACHDFAMGLLMHSAYWLRGKMIESVLSQYLVENFDVDWFLNPRTGDFFREVWHDGRRITAEQFARQLAYPSLTFDFVIDTIETALR